MAALSPCCLATETPKQLKQAADCIMNCVACQAALLRLADRVFIRQALRLTVLKKSPEALELLLAMFERISRVHG